MATQKPKTKCPSCGNDEGYHRVKTDDYRCKKCGKIWEQTETFPVCENNLKDCPSCKGTNLVVMNATYCGKVYEGRKCLACGLMWSIEDIDGGDKE